MDTISIVRIIRNHMKNGKLGLLETKRAAEQIQKAYAVEVQRKVLDTIRATDELKARTGA